MGETYVAFLVGLVAFVFVAWNFGFVPGLFAGGICGLGFHSTIGREIASKRTAMREEARKLHIVELKKILSGHMPALLRRHRQLYRVDEYGIVDDRKWMFEVNRFSDNIAAPALKILPAPHVGRKSEPRRDILDTDIAALVLAAANEQQATFADEFDPAMNPIAYEHFCAARLRLSGWNANVTQASADQGADVVATKAGQTIVVQCKHYAKPVGNKAVQEVVAARMHYNADASLVVAPNGFTRSAEALASSNNVMLVSHDDLTPQFKFQT